MSDLTKRLRALAEEWWECCGDIHVPITEAADALDAAEAKLAAIDALHQPIDLHLGDQGCETCDVFWPCPTHRILHPKETK